MAGRKFRILLGILAVHALVFQSACSPKSLFGKSDPSNDSAEVNQYRPLNPNCSHLDLSSPEITGKEFRSLLKCFNAYGALDPIQRLFDRLSDDQVQDFAQLTNKHVLGDPALLWEIEQSYFLERNTGAFDASLQSVAKFFSHPELTASLLSLLHTDSDALARKIPSILQAIGNRIDADSSLSAIELALSFSGSEAFQDLQSKVRSDAPGGKLDVEGVTSLLLDEFRAAQTARGVSLLNEINAELKNGDLFKALDQVLGTGSDSIARNAPVIAAVFPPLTAKNGEILTALGRLFSTLQTPLQCLRGTQQVPDPVSHLFSELSKLPDGGAVDFIRRNHLLTLIALEPFCDYPDTLKTDYSKLVELADTDGMLGVERLIKAAYPIQKEDGSRPLVDLYKKFFSDPQTNRALPLFDELTARQAWADLVLLLGLPGEKDRARLVSGLSFLMDPLPELGGGSIKDFLADLAVSGGLKKALPLTQALQKLLNGQDSWVTPILESLRTGYYATRSHPYIEFTKKLFLDAPGEERFFRTLFAISEYPEFSQSLQLIGTMAADGRLKQLIGDSVSLMHGIAIRGKHAVLAASEPAYAPSRRHNLSAKELTEYHTSKLLSFSADACAKLAPGISIADLGDAAGFDREWSGFMNCLALQDAATAFEELRSNRTERGESELALAVDLTRDLGHALTTDELGYLGNLWLRTEGDGSFDAFLDSVSHWIDRKIAEPAGEILSALFSHARPSFQAVEKFAAQTLRREDFPALTLELDRLSQQKQDPEASTFLPAPDLARLKRWLQNKEYEKIPAAASSRETWLEARAEEVVRGYRDAVTPLRNPDGTLHLSWDLSELKKVVEPFLAKFADPSASRPEHTLTDAFLDFFKDYGLAPGERPNATQHFTRQELAEWFELRARDPRLVTQYDFDNPPESSPHVVYADTLDRLMNLVLNADFEYLAPGLDKLGVKVGINLGMKALADIGDSWGDEPYEAWPEEIKAKYAHSRPPTLRETVTDLERTLDLMKSTVGLLPDWSVLDLNTVKRRIYNLAQIFDVLKENLPDSGTPYAGGDKLLRSLFFQLSTSTPKQFQGELAGLKNNLSFISFFGRSGLTRQLSFDLRHHAPGDPVIRDYFGAFVSFAEEPRSKLVFDQIFAKDPHHELFWSFAQALMPVMGNPLPVSGEVRLDALRGKQTLFDGLGALEKMGLIRPAVEAVAVLLDGNTDLWSAHAPDLVRGLTAEPSARFARALYNDEDSVGKRALFQWTQTLLADSSLLKDAVALIRATDRDPRAHAALDVLGTRLETIALGRTVADFFEERLDDPRAAEAERAIRAYLAKHLENGDFEQVLLIAAHDPAQFENLLDTLGKYIKNGDLKEFFAYLRRSIQPVN